MGVPLAYPSTPSTRPCRFTGGGFLMPERQTPMTEHHHETSDSYAAVVIHLTDALRVISCKDDRQWVLQKRVGGSGKWPWRAKGYFRTRNALTRVTAGLGAPTGNLEALPPTYRPDARAKQSAPSPALY